MLSHSAGVRPGNYFNTGSLLSTEAQRGQWGHFFFGDTFSKSDLNWFPTVFMTWELVNPFYFHFFQENVFSCVEKKILEMMEKKFAFLS